MRWLSILSASMLFRLRRGRTRHFAKRLTSITLTALAFGAAYLACGVLYNYLTLGIVPAELTDGDVSALICPLALYLVLGAALLRIPAKLYRLGAAGDQEKQGGASLLYRTVVERLLRSADGLANWPMWK